MQFIPEIVVICLIFFLYSVFVFTKDNFVLLRKNVTLEQLFNIAFSNFFFSIFCARIVYILEHLSINYLNPLVFLLFPYFPGLSFAGGIAGCIFFLWYSTKKKKLPFLNIFDIFSLSLFLSIPIGMLLITLGNFIILRRVSYVFIWSSLAEFILLASMSLLFTKNKFKDGSLGFLIFSFITFTQFILRMFLRSKANYFRLDSEDILLAVITIILLIFCIRQESLQSVTKKR